MRKSGRPIKNLGSPPILKKLVLDLVVLLNFLRAIARKPRPNAQNPVQSSILDLTNFHTYDRAHCLMNFDANRIKRY